MTIQQNHQMALLQAECISEFLLTCKDPEKIKVMNALKREVLRKNTQSYISKKQVAQQYGIDKRTLRNRIYSTGCAGELSDMSIQAKWSYDNQKMFQPSQMLVIYKHLGTPSQFKTEIE